MRYELSKKQIEEARNSFNENFNKWAVFRKIFNVKKIGETRIKKTDDFVTIGFNHIVERDWFSNYTGTTYYDHTTLGMTRGKGVALGESRYILNQINDVVSKLEVSIQVQKDDISHSIYRRIQNNNQKNSLAILANPTIISSLLNEEQFKLTGEVNIWGYYHDVPVMWSPEVEKKSVYIINRNAGLIIVKEDRFFKVSELDISEYDKILSDIDTLTLADLLISVRVTAKETIKFSMSPNLPLIIQKITCGNEETNSL